MITIKIFPDGSALKTWHSRLSDIRGDHSSYTVMSPEEVQKNLNSICTNNKEDCGMCLTCKIKQTYKERGLP